MTSPARVWLMRHAETATPAVFHGAESDVGLSELGFRQAAAAADWFRAHAPTVVVSSAMRRAIDTAIPIATACGVPHQVEPGLHERRVGILCGVDFAASNGPWADTVSEWSAGNTAYTTTGAESFDELAARVLAAWERVIAAHPDGRVVIVAHGVVCKALLLSLLEGHDVSHWSTLGRVANVSVTELAPVGSRWRAEQLLTVPPPAAALTDGLPTGVGPLRIRSEA
jgi:probable phosphoglycerate mutase